MRLTQTQAAERIGVNPWTILNWEKGNGHETFNYNHIITMR